MWDMKTAVGVCAMGVLRRTYQIGFWVAGIAAVIYVVAGLVSFTTEMMNGGIEVADRGASLTVLISGVTCVVSTLTAFSTLLLSWRLDRRQSREAELRFAQMQIELDKARTSQTKVEDHS
jgi:hypothetical protein